MYWGYNLLKIDVTIQSPKKEKHEYKFNLFANELKKTMLDIGNGIIDATKIQDNWFPNINADIFISHSHADKEYAESIAMWLEDRFDLSSFIDSDCWGNKDDIFETLIQISPQEEYDHNDIIRLSDNISNILQGALVKMIDNCDCFMFLNTNNSLIPFDLNIDDSKTFSPWLYFELLTAKHIEKKRKLYRNHLPMYSKSILERKQILPTPPRFEHQAHLDNLSILDFDILQRWDEKYKKSRNTDPFDVLKIVL